MSTSTLSVRHWWRRVRPTTPASSWASLAVGAFSVAIATFVALAPWSDAPATFPHYGLGILAVPLLVEFACGRRLAPIQRLWLTLGLSLHPLATLYELYQNVWWFDHLTHFLSATLVVGGGYLYVLARDHQRTSLPSSRASREMHLQMFVLIVAAGVIWEVFEFFWPMLPVHSAADTAGDLVFDVVGWGAMVWVHPYLLGSLPEHLADRLGGPALLTDGGDE